MGCCQPHSKDFGVAESRRRCEVNHETRTSWYCPYYKRDIAEGKCLDINYERLGYMDAGCLREVTQLTGKTKTEIDETCETCPNFPFEEGLPEEQPL